LNDASEEQKQEHKKLCQQRNRSTCALQQWKQMQPAFARRRTILLSDARFTTQRFLSGLPSEIALIGRVRKDAKTFYPPTTQPAVGRRLYGARTHSRTDSSGGDPPLARVHAAGADHDCRVKVVSGLLWPPAGALLLLAAGRIHPADLLPCPNGEPATRPVSRRSVSY